MSVLITGASSGIGLEMAKIFAHHGYDLIVASRSKEKMDILKRELEKQYKIRVDVCSVDLSQENGAILLYEEIKTLGAKVEILVNNAGAGYVGDFVEAECEKDLSIMTLNMTNLTLLTKYFSQEMIENGGGKILNVASTGSYHPGPYTATYYATKAYVLSLSEALWLEMKPYNITVSALCPGATKTNFAKSAGKVDSNIAMSPAFVAKAAYKGLMKGKRVIIPGMRNKLFVKLPRWLVIGMIGRYQAALADKTK